MKQEVQNLVAEINQISGWTATYDEGRRGVLLSFTKGGKICDALAPDDTFVDGWPAMKHYMGRVVEEALEGAQP